MGTKVIEYWEYSPAHPNGVKTGETIIPTVPIVLTKKDCRLRVIQGLMTANGSNNSAARARMQNIREQVQALTPDTDAKRRARGAYDAWLEDATFTKVEFQTIISDIRGGTDMTAGEETAINADWPEA